jgi:hypothetical protein
MDQYRELLDRLQQIAGKAQSTCLYQGTVTSVEGATCTVQLGSLSVPGVKLRASVKAESSQLLVVPAIGSDVIIGSLSGDLDSLTVLAVDKVESITINGGTLGGLINIDTLTERLNELVNVFNSHTHPATSGTTSPTLTPASSFVSADYEDDTITH